MNARILKALVLAVAVLGGALAGRFFWPAGETARTPTDQGGEREILYWQAPMDPGYRRDRPGKSPMGMDLVPVYADAEDGVISIDPVVVNNMGVRIAKAEHGSLSRRIETVGYVGYDEDTLTHVHTRVDGWVDTLAVKSAGDPVQPGQLLFELYSPTLVNAEREYLASSQSGTAALRAASHSRLLALGVGEAEIARLERERSVKERISVHAHHGGVVAALGVRQGMYVTPATDVMSIARLDSVWIQAEVFERQAAWVMAGQTAEIELDSRPGSRRAGTVDYVYPELDPKTRALRVRLLLANEEMAMRPNMFARVVIQGTPTEPVVHVPRAAVIRGAPVDRVVVALGDGRFRVQPVTLGIESGDRIAVLEGLAADEAVVTSAQFLIDSEANVEAALARMQGEPPLSAPAGRAQDHAGHGAAPGESSPR